LLCISIYYSRNSFLPRLYYVLYWDPRRLLGGSLEMSELINPNPALFLKSAFTSPAGANMGPTASFYWLLGPRAGRQRSSGQWQNRVGLVNSRQISPSLNHSLSATTPLIEPIHLRNTHTHTHPHTTLPPHNHNGSPVKVQRPLGPVPPYRALRARPDPDPPGNHLRGSSRCGAPGCGTGGLAGPRPHGPDGQHRCVRLVPPSPPPTAPPRLPATKHSRT
jgi:hypothetical protein